MSTPYLIRLCLMTLSLGTSTAAPGVAQIPSAGQTPQALEHKPTPRSCIEILKASASRHPASSDAPITIDKLRADLPDLFATLKRCWANRVVHESLDGYTLDQRIAAFQSALDDPKLTPADFYNAVSNWAFSLGDGHLVAEVPGKVFWNSNATVIDTAPMAPR